MLALWVADAFHWAKVFEADELPAAMFSPR
jgi:hypothetical protein